MNCKEIQDLLAEDVEVATRNSEIEEHVKSCASCRKLLGQLHEVNAALNSMPEVTVPQAVIWKTMDAVEAKKVKPFRLLKLSLAAGIPVILLLMISLTFGAADQVRVLFASSAETLSGQEAPPRLADPGRLHQHANLDGLDEDSPNIPLGVDGRFGAEGKAKLDDGERPAKDLPAKKPADSTGHAYRLDSPIIGDETDTDTWNRKYVPPVGRTTVETLLSGERTKALMKRRNATVQVIRLSDGTKTSESEEKENETGIAGLDEKKALAEFENDRSREEAKFHDRLNDPEKALSHTKRVAKLEKTIDELKEHKWRSKANLELRKKTKKLDAAQLPKVKLIENTDKGNTYTRPDSAKQWENALSLIKQTAGTTPPRETENSEKDKKEGNDRLDPEELPLDELEFIPARGYFANTYLPGDPSVAWLRRKLEKEISMQGRDLILEKACAPYLQPFDAPSADGVDVFLHTDRPAVEGPARLTLQVGLKGSLRHAKHRAPLNAALVIDLRALPPEQHRKMLWMVADAVANNQQAGDHFSLVVAGVKKPLRVKPNRFDMVTVRRNLAQALHDMEKSGGVESLQAALEVAYNKVGGEGADDAPLGANLVLLVSAAPVGSGLEAMQSLAHRQALLGINLTSIGVGSEADMDALGALAMAGQGRRRLIVDANQTRTTVEAELSASGRVVARALRLRIRLGAGVKLIEILGSHPLNAARTERVRESEQAIDQRVAKTLGIEADRGEDEDGIQIVIPAYYAGDDHVVLLDVMVPGPGKVAEVRLRYKDLVRLRNSVASASLNLEARTRPDDPLTRNVQKNLLAYRLSEDLLQAARQLEKGRFDQVMRTLAKSSVRIAKLQGRFPELRSDPELGKDLNMLAEYLDVLMDHQNWQHDRQIQVHLIRSLAYAGKTKLPPGVSHISPVP